MSVSDGGESEEDGVEHTTMIGSKNSDLELY